MAQPLSPLTPGGHEKVVVEEAGSLTTDVRLMFIDTRGIVPGSNLLATKRDLEYKGPGTTVPICLSV